MISSVVPTNFPFVRGLTPNKNSILSESVVDAGRRRPDCPLVPKGDVISQPPDGTQNGPIRPTSRILLSLAGFGATTMTSPSRGRTPSIAIMFSPWVTTTSVPGPRHAPIVSRAPAVSAACRAVNTKALGKWGASYIGPMSIKFAFCWQRHHWELTILPTLTRCARKRSPRACASARPCSLGRIAGRARRRGMADQSNVSVGAQRGPC